MTARYHDRPYTDNSKTLPWISPGRVCFYSDDPDQMESELHFGCLPAHLFKPGTILHGIFPCGGDTVIAVLETCQSACDGTHGICVISKINTLKKGFLQAVGRNQSPY